MERSEHLAVAGRNEFDAMARKCAEYREHEVGKLFCRLMELDAQRRLQEMVDADERLLPRLQGGVQAVRELRKRVG